MIGVLPLEIKGKANQEIMFQLNEVTEIEILEFLEQIYPRDAWTIEPNYNGDYRDYVHITGENLNEVSFKLDFSPVSCGDVRLIPTYYSDTYYDVSGNYFEINLENLINLQNFLANKKEITESFQAFQSLNLTSDEVLCALLETLLEYEVVSEEYLYDFRD